MKECSITGCEKAARARGWCSAHYGRWRVHGDPLNAGAYQLYTDPAEAFLARTEPIVGDPGCLIWTGATNQHGHARMGIGGRTVYVHRYAWERSRGPIPEGVVIDHECWNRTCVNVEHLRLATQQQNMQNRSGATLNNGTGLRGAYPGGNGYMARVVHGGASHYLGVFPTAVEAAAVAAEKRQELFGEFAGRG